MNGKQAKSTLCKTKWRIPFIFFFLCSASGSFNIVQFPLHTELCQVGEKVDKVRSPSEAAGSAQFRSIVLTATIKNRGSVGGSSAFCCCSHVSFQFFSNICMDWLFMCYCAESCCCWIWSWLSRLHLCRCPCVRALSLLSATGTSQRGSEAEWGFGSACTAQTRSFLTKKKTKKQKLIHSQVHHQN